jgi:hypothetical protein
VSSHKDTSYRLAFQQLDVRVLLSRGDVMLSMLGDNFFAALPLYDAFIARPREVS